jgi:tripeptidyl-peptidase-1
VSSLSNTNEWIEFTTTVGQANSLFGTSYQTYSHSATRRTLTRTLAYSLPEALVGHVDTIAPTTGFEAHPHFLHNSKPPAKRPNAPSHCNTLAPGGYITPDCLQVLQCEW